MATPSVQRGFSLIELLFTVAIIGLLSAIVLGSLQTARLRASDASVRQQAVELRSLMELERVASGNYNAIKTGGAWKAAGTSCAQGTFSGTYAAQAAQICTALVRASGPACGTSCTYFGATANNNAQKFTIMAYLPAASAAAGEARWLCVGSSGNQSVSNGSPWGQGGCYANP